jgi:hypothetical protein
MRHGKDTSSFDQCVNRLGKVPGLHRGKSKFRKFLFELKIPSRQLLVERVVNLIHNFFF